MSPSAALKLKEAYREDSRVYFRVFVDDAEKPSLVFTSVPELTAHGVTELQTWCERHLSRFDSGATVEATFDS
jgi:hypothetical protein